MLTKSKLIISISALVFIFSGCGEKNNNTTENSPSSQNTKQSEISESKSMTLTSEYLVGKWCYAYRGTEEAKKEQFLNWEFKEDGKWYEQTSSHNPKMKHKGKWKIEEDKLLIKPAYMGGPHPVTIVSQDEFIYTFFVELHIQRGICKQKSKTLLDKGK